MENITVAIYLGLLLGGYLIGFLINKSVGKNKINSADAEAKRIISMAEKNAEATKKEKILEAKEEWYKRKQDFDQDSSQKRNKLQEFEKQLNGREENIDRKLELVNKKDRENQQKDKSLQEKSQTLEQKLSDVNKIIDEENLKLENISQISRDEARRQLLENLIENVKIESAHLIKEVREKAKEEAKLEAQKIVIQAIQRSATDYALESTGSVISIEGDEIKGRIIGREGRNIRALEAATGVDIIIDDTPEAVILSSFDPFRREVAKVSLERLIADGRIHPARIEEVVEKVKKELEEEIKKIGENAFLTLGLTVSHPEIVRHVGRMKYRSSYGQNLLQHSLETAKICEVMANELHLDPQLAKRGALLHDIGKTVDKSIEGPHAIIGYELAKKYHEHPIVTNSIGAHHDDIPMEHAISALVQVADSISGARPGARRESIEGYAKRLEKLEAIAMANKGVAKTYAIQAGREVRVIVEPDKINDLQSEQLAIDLAKKIQQDMEYPGQIKVVVIREYRSSAIAK